MEILEIDSNFQTNLLGFDFKGLNAVAYVLFVVEVCFCGATKSFAANVDVSANVVGQTPEIVGYNVAHFMPGSNTESWWQYAGVNGARLWSSPGAVEPNDDNGVWGDGVVDEASFLAQRANLRSDPLNTSLINWPVFESNFATRATSGNILLLNHALGRLRANDISVLATIHRSAGSYPFAAQGTQAGYQDRWEHWQHFYAQAFHMARHFDVQRYQMYNEPNHSSNANLSQAEYLERLQLASDAVTSAIADVNQIFGKSLSTQLHAPVNSGGNKVLANPGGDPRDDMTGWGELVIDNRHTDLFGSADSNNDIFQTYTYHFYNQTGPSAGDTLADVKADVDVASGGEDFRFAISEFNVHTAGTFAGLTETLDSPSKIARFGSIFANLANNQPDELYVFKFGQTDNQAGGTIKKNGTHYVGNDNSPYDTGGATKGAGVVRLFAKGFKGSRPLLAMPSPTGSGADDLRLSAAHDTDAGRYYLFSTNVAGNNPVTLDLDLNAWDIKPGTQVVVEEVSGNRHGEVTHMVTVPASRIVSLDQPARSTWLVSIPDSGPREEVIFSATDDAMVKSGSNVNTNYGGSQNLQVKSDPANPNARNVSFMKFDLGTTETNSIDQAILRVTGEDPLSPHGVIAHVYAVLDDSWDEDSITWNTAPNLGNSIGTVHGIEDNFVEGIGSTAKFVGHLTSSPTESLLQLDITDFVKDHGDQLISLLVTREVRWDGENVDDAVGSLQIASKERVGGTGPQLLLLLDIPPLPGDFNEDGSVNSQDLSRWQAGYGTPNGAIHQTGDADGDADVDGVDLLQWQRDSNPSPSTAAAQQTVPEPSTLVLLSFRLFVGWRDCQRAFLKCGYCTPQQVRQ